MILKVLNSALIVFVVYLALKHGWYMLTAKPEAVNIFAKWGLGKPYAVGYGLILCTAAIFILFPKTFVWGNYIMAAGILLFICFQVYHHQLQEALVEVPFLLLNLIILYLQHPLKSL
jgi:hypothetical protein